MQHLGDFPFILTTGRVLKHYNCGTMTRRTGIARIVTEDVLAIHPFVRRDCGDFRSEGALRSHREEYARPVRRKVILSRIGSGAKIRVP